MRHDHGLVMCHGPFLDGIYIYMYVCLYIYITRDFLQHSFVATFQRIPSFEKKRIPAIWKRMMMFCNYFSL